MTVADATSHPASAYDTIIEAAKPLVHRSIPKVPPPVYWPTDYTTGD